MVVLILVLYVVKMICFVLFLGNMIFYLFGWIVNVFWGNFLKEILFLMVFFIDRVKFVVILFINKKGFFFFVGKYW